MEKGKRHRRTKEELDNIIWSTLEKQVAERGFNNVTLVGLAREAGVEPPVIYQRFEDLDELLEECAKKYDYWLNDIFKLKKEYTGKENLKKLLTDLIYDLYDNEIMQRILLWGLNDTHAITRSLAANRDMSSTYLLEYFSPRLDSGINSGRFTGITSLIISGIYYLILQRRIAPFCYIDYNTPQGKQVMIETVTNMVDKLFTEITPPADDKIAEIARKLLENGVDKDIIKNCLDYDFCD